MQGSGRKNVDWSKKAAKADLGYERLGSLGAIAAP
jgi:hypothetical protein